MKIFSTSAVTSGSSLLQPKIEVNSLLEDDLNSGPFQQLETQLLDSMEISEQQPSHSPKPEVFGDEHMHEPGSSINLEPGNKNLACLRDLNPKVVSYQPVVDVPIDGRSSIAKNAHALTKKQGLDKQLKHSDWLRKYLKEKGKIPVVFREKDGHPVGKYAKAFKTELGIAVKRLAPLQVSGWKSVTEEQKRPIFDWLERSFTVNFGSVPSLVKKVTDNIMSTRYRDYRQKMHEHYKTLSQLTWEERLKHRPKDNCQSKADWEFVCKMFESHTFKKASVINSGNRAKQKPIRSRGGLKSLAEYRYDGDDGSEEEDDMTVSNVSYVTTNSGKGCPREYAETVNNDKQTGLDNKDDGGQSVEEVDVAKQAHDEVQETRAGYAAGLGNGLEPELITSDAASLVAELRKELVSTQNELHSTRAALQLTEDRIVTLEANQKRLEETVQATTQVVEANQRMMRQVFERIASGIAQSLTPQPFSAPHL